MNPSLNGMRLRGLWLTLLLATHLLAMFLPAQGGTEDGAGVYGYHMFYLGAIYSILVIYLPWTWPWLANPYFYLGCYWLATGRARLARAAGIVATVMALGYLPYMVGPWVPSHTRALGAAYYVWVGGMALLALAGWRCGRAEPPSQELASPLPKAAPAAPEAPIFVSPFTSTTRPVQEAPPAAPERIPRA